MGGFIAYFVSDGAFYFWLIAMVLFGAVEAATLSLTSIWFTLGALPAMILAGLGAPFGAQVALFLVTSILLLVFTRPIAQRKLRREKTNVDAVVGQQVLVTQSIDNMQNQGEVRIGGLLWSARSENGQPIAQGACVQVRAVQGVKVIVAPAEASAKLK